MNNSQIIITVTATGVGKHEFKLRVNNLIINKKTQLTDLKQGIPVTVKWQCKISSLDEPWFAVVVPDKDLINKKEVMGIE